MHTIQSKGAEVDLRIYGAIMSALYSVGDFGQLSMKLAPITFKGGFIRVV